MAYRKDISLICVPLFHILGFMHVEEDESFIFVEPYTYFLVFAKEYLGKLLTEEVKTNPGYHFCKQVKKAAEFSAAATVLKQAATKVEKLIAQKKKDVISIIVQHRVYSITEREKIIELDCREMTRS